MEVVIRADGSHDIGYGHLVRSGTLAREFLRRGHSVTYATRTPLQVEEVCPDGVSIYEVEGEDGPNNTAWLANTSPQFVITDSHDIATDYQRAIKENVPVLATVIDDARHTIFADIIINDNVYAPAIEYRWIGSEPTWCLGPDFSLLREGFRRLATETPPWRDSVDRALVIMGGSDKENRTQKVMRAFDETNLRVTVVIGPGFENERQVRQTAKTMDRSFDLKIDPERLPKLMFQSDFAVSTLGTTVQELLATQTPIIGIPDNRTPIADVLEERELALVLTRDATYEDVASAIRRMVNDTDYRRKLWDVSSKIISKDGPEKTADSIEEAYR